jgi:trehalose-6-phosphate synthase
MRVITQGCERCRELERQLRLERERHAYSRKLLDLARGDRRRLRAFATLIRKVG